MIPENYKEVIIEYINSGFDLKIMSVELEIPLEELMKIKLDLDREKERSKLLDQEQENARIEQERKKTLLRQEQEEARKRAKEKKEASRFNTLSKLDYMKRKYNELFAQDTSISKQSEKEKKKIEDEINKIEESMKKLSELDDAKSVYNLIKNINLAFNYKIKNLPFTTDQAIKLYNIIHAKKFNNSNEQDIDIKKIYSNKQASTIYHSLKYKTKFKLADTISIEASRTSDIDRLNQLSEILSSEYFESISIDSIKTIIFRKKQSLEIQNNSKISPEISSIVRQLAEGNIDFENANKIIEAEAGKKQSGLPKTKFSLSLEKQKEIIYSKIKTKLGEDAYKYPITNPEKTIKQTMKLCGGVLHFTVTAVLNNLLDRKKIEEAKKMVEKLSKNEELENNIKFYNDKIKYAEIGDIILRGLTAQGTQDERDAYIELIESGLEKNRINASLIKLGKNSAGTRTIALSDILPSQREKI